MSPNSMSRRKPMMAAPALPPAALEVSAAAAKRSSPISKQALLTAPCTPLRWVQTAQGEITFEVLALVTAPAGRGAIGKKGIAFVPHVEVESGRLEAAVVPVKDTLQIHQIAAQQERAMQERLAAAAAGRPN